MSPGLWYGVAAYSIWGLFPIYWRLFPHVPAMQVLAHRIVWSLAVLVLLLAGSRRGARAGIRLVGVGTLTLGALAGCLIGAHWFLFVWAVNAGFIVETSLGYFITPLINVLLGVLVFRERLRPLQWLAVALAAAGVLYLARAYGTLPWVALGLAATFGGYGLVKKKAPLGSLDGLTLETAILFLPALWYLAAAHQGGTGVFLRTDVASDLLLAGGGVVTVGPLLLFASAVQRVPLSMIGILQFISPTLQFVLGVFVYGEPFSRTQLTGFAVIWSALALFSVDGFRARERSALMAAAAGAR